MFSECLVHVGKSVHDGLINYECKNFTKAKMFMKKKVLENTQMFIKKKKCVKKQKGLQRLKNDTILIHY